MTNEEAIEELKRDIHNAKVTHHLSEHYEMAIKALDQQPCEDAIDRAEAMTEIMMFAGNVKSDEENIYIKVSDAVQLLRELPSIQPKTGRWINDKYGQHCDQCGNGINTPYKFCPFCGADMREYTSEIPADSEKEQQEMMGKFEFTLHSPLTKEDWNKLLDAEYKNTMFVTFQTPQGRQVRYIKCEVLDKIRTEIKEESRFCPLTEGLERALEIINKYATESEDKE